MINLLCSGLLTLLLLSGCGTGGTPNRINDFVPLTSIKIVAVSPTIAVSQTIAVNTSTKFMAIGSYSGLFTRDITDQVVWASNSPTVANFINSAVNSNRVTGIAPGIANLTATVGGISGAYTLKVSNATITSMAITPANPSVPQGLTTQFTASGTFSDSTAQDLTFDASWDSSDVSVATVSNDPASKGFAKAIAAVGTATITATFPLTNGVSGTALLTATPPVPLSITVTATNSSVLSISTVKNNFTAIGKYSDGSTADITSQAVWTSSSPGIATITTTGDTLTTQAQGTTLISATLAGVSGVTNLNVTGGSLISIIVSPGFVPLVKGSVRQLTVTGIFDNTAQRDITGMVTWSPNDSNLATVTPAGGNLAYLNAIAETPSTSVTARITVPSGLKTASTNLTVTAPTLVSLAINPPLNFVDLTSGTSSSFTLAATFNDGTIQDVTASSTAWLSSDNNIATVGDIGSSKGRVTGVAAGTVSISASYGGLNVTAPAVTITVRTLQSLTISNISALFPGRQVNFTATANYAGGISKVVTEDTDWLPSNTNVAIFPDNTNYPGQMVAVDTGSASVKATFPAVGGLSVSVPITVQ